MVEYKNYVGVKCDDDKEIDEYLRSAYSKYLKIMKSICEEIDYRMTAISKCIDIMRNSGMACSEELSDSYMNKIASYLRNVHDYYKSADYICDEPEVWQCVLDTLGNEEIGNSVEVAENFGLADFMEKYLSDLDFKAQKNMCPDTSINRGNVIISFRTLEELRNYCDVQLVYSFNNFVLKFMRKCVNNLLHDKPITSLTGDSFDFAGAKSKIANGANNIFQSLFSKRKVFINEDLYKKIEDDIIKTHKKADDIVNEIISNYYNGVNAENPATTTEEQQAPDIEGDMAQIDAMLKDLNSEEVEAPTAEVASEEKPQSTQEVTEAIDNAQGSITDSLEEEFRKLKESLGLD